MCDSLCRVTDRGTIFAKSSDRPVGEPQIVETFPAESVPSGATTTRTQYLTVERTGSLACLLSRPVWLWGAEHGINSNKVVIGNEKVFTIDDPYEAPPALTGMDLVRLGLERGRTAREALDVITDLLDRYGQGGVGDAKANEPYWSSFLIADPIEAWILETSYKTWAAHRVDASHDGIAAISNRLTLGRNWEVSSPDVPSGSDFDSWRSPAAPTGHADVRLSASQSFLASLDDHSDGGRDPRREANFVHEDVLDEIGEFAAHMRDHGTGRWGNPLRELDDAVPPPTVLLPDGTGVTICMHVRGFIATAASMLAFLPSGEGESPRAWVALGSPCSSVFIPVLPPHAAPRELASESTWQRFDELRRQVENDPPYIEAVRSVLAPIERSLWLEASEFDTSAKQWSTFHEDASRRVLAGLESLGV